MSRSRRSSSVSRNARRPTPISARPSIQSNSDGLQRNIGQPITTTSSVLQQIAELYGEAQPRSTRPTGTLHDLIDSITGVLQRMQRSLPESLERPGPSRSNLDLSEEVTHEAPMTPQQIKHSIESRPDTNQDIKFMEKKKCGVCLGSWKEILMEGKHLVFTECGHIFCRDCAIRFASEGKRECPLCKKSLAGVNPPFRRLHMPLDPRLKKSRAD